MERPGKADLISDVDGLNERIEELKKLVALKEKEVCIAIDYVFLQACCCTVCTN